jgi:hypothetical protein
MWIFNSADKDLDGSFKVTQYAAVGTTLEVGANLKLKYIPGPDDPLPFVESLHWIQRVISNHNLKDNLHDDMKMNEDVIDIDSGATNPFYKIDFDADGIEFRDSPRRFDPFRNHNWVAELYLVEQTEPQTNPQNVTIYNGIQWGWENNVVVEPAPEPVTIFGSGMGLGLGVLFKKYLSKQKKAKNLEKLKS